MRRAAVWGLWTTTIAAVLVSAVQGLSGHWVTFFLVWPGGTEFGEPFIRAMLTLADAHRAAGYAIGGLSVLILVLAFLTRSSLYVRLFAIVGFGMAALAIAGGVVYVASGFGDRWSLGQMADAFVGVLGAYLIQLFFMNRTPAFPWSRAKGD